MKFWIVKGNPEINELSEMLVPNRKGNWYDPCDQAKNGAKAGDGIFFWSSRRDRFLIGLGKMGNPFTGRDGNYYRFDLTYLTRELPNKVKLNELKAEPLFDPKSPNCPYFVIPGPVQTRYPLTTTQARRLAEMILARNSDVTGLSQILHRWFPSLIPQIHEEYREELEPEALEFPEGPRSYAIHVRYERSTKAVNEAKNRHRAKHNGKLPCTICKFDFSAKYNKLGQDFAEVHHMVPLSDYKLTGKEVTLPSDLIVVCANCHRMLHRRRPCLTVKNLETLLVKSR